MLAFTLATSSVFAQVATFETETYDYGQIKQHDTAPRLFKFTNTGTAPLVIKNAQASCGCTAPKFSQEPLMPGAYAVIEAKYNAAAIGNFTKYITVTTNDPKRETIQLVIKGEVLTPENTATAVQVAGPK